MMCLNNKLHRQLSSALWLEDASQTEVKKKKGQEISALEAEDLVVDSGHVHSDMGRISIMSTC